MPITCILVTGYTLGYSFSVGSSGTYFPSTLARYWSSHSKRCIGACTGRIGAVNAIPRDERKSLLMCVYPSFHGGFTASNNTKALIPVISNISHNTTTCQRQVGYFTVYVPTFWSITSTPSLVLLQCSITIVFLSLHVSNILLVVIYVDWIVYLQLV